MVAIESGASIENTGVFLRSGGQGYVEIGYFWCDFLAVCGTFLALFGRLSILI